VKRKLAETKYYAGFGYIFLQFMGHLHGKYIVIFPPQYENFLDMSNAKLISC
jgi:hypothetical protein